VSEPLVTIVTPSFNQAAYLGEAIASVLAQDYPRIEYAVADGGSTDGSVEILKRYDDRLAWWTSAPDGGQAAALNTAFARAEGEILGWLNSDDTLLPGAVSRVVAELERDPELALVYGDAEFVDESGASMFTLHARPFDKDAMVRACANHVVQPGSLFRRLAWRPFDEQAYYFFDFQFVLGLEARQVRRLEGPPLATYRVHAASKSVGEPLRKAHDYARMASVLPPEGRRAAWLGAGEYFYDALELGPARRALLRARPTSPRGLGLLAKAWLPRTVVAAAKRRRAARD